TAEFLASLLQRGFARVKVGGRVLDLSPPPGVDLSEAREILVVLDRVILVPDQRGRLSDSMEMAFREGGGRVEVEVLGREPRVFTQEFRCPTCNLTLARPQPLLFSFNHPLGACPDCKGFGNILRYDEARLVPDPSRSLADCAVEPWSHPSGRWYQKELLKAAKRRGLDVSRPYADLTDADKQWLQEGDRHFSGIRGFFEEVETYRYKLHVRVFLSRYRSQFPCPRCSGARLKAEALAVKVGGLTIAECTALTVEDLARFLRGLGLRAWEEAVAREILKQLHAKLGFLLRVGLGYLTLSRQTRTLSGGEAQRINLANQLGSQLVGTLYVLDEPSIGLHARDTARLAELCRELAGAGNTVVVVEHDRTFMEAADYLVELGPGSGERGGEV
ncbi:MAG: excinuclease ABC subunit A, partial [candidate division NC10 bacterium]